MTFIILTLLVVSFFHPSELHVEWVRQLSFKFKNWSTKTLKQWLKKYEIFGRRPEIVQNIDVKLF